MLRILARIDSKQFEKAFVKYVRETLGKEIPGGEVLAMDGKTIRRSGYSPKSEDKTPHKASHVVSAWATSMGVCFGQTKTEERKD